MARRIRRPHFPVADVGDVEEFAAGLNSKQIECRSDGHDMRKHDVEPFDGGWKRTRKCRRCGALRIQILDSRGLILGTKMKYKDGYQMPKGTGRLDSEGNGVFRAVVIEAEFAQLHKATG
jgi:hypothetical protein